MEKIALVTGSSSGIGFETSLALARNGFHTFASMRDVGKCEEIKQTIEKEDLSVEILELDVDKEESVDLAIKTILEKKDRIDVLVNNAGLLIAKPALEVTLDDWDQVMSINVRGCYFMSQYVARHLIEEGRSGSIINIASTFTVIGTPNVSPYGVSKAAVGGITRHLAVEWAKYGIRVNAVAPGTVETKLRAKILAADPERRATNMAKIPMGRFGTPEDMAGAVSYLASPSSSYVNGHVLTVDGGLTIS